MQELQMLRWQKQHFLVPNFDPQTLHWDSMQSHKAYWIKEIFEDLAEAIILAGQPIFLTYQGGKPVFVEKLEERSTLLILPSLAEYPNDPLIHTDPLGHVLRATMLK